MRKRFVRQAVPAQCQRHAWVNSLITRSRCPRTSTTPCSSSLRTCVAAREPEKVIAAIAAPATRWVTLTVTEKGYGLELAALLVKGLAARRSDGLGGLSIASCDNLTDNGRKLRQLCVDAAGPADTGLAQWIASACAFPNSMVDRIVPAATAQQRADASRVLGLDDACALGTEGFWEWVIERRFADATDGPMRFSIRLASACWRWPPYGAMHCPMRRAGRRASLSGWSGSGPLACRPRWRNCKLLRIRASPFEPANGFLASNRPIAQAGSAQVAMNSVAISCGAP